MGIVELENLCERYKNGSRIKKLAADIIKLATFQNNLVKIKKKVQLKKERNLNFNIFPSLKSNGSIRKNGYYREEKPL